MEIVIYIYISEGVITSDLNIIVINNETRNSIITHLLTARITDDNNNTIKFSKSTKLQFVISGEGSFDAVQDNDGIWTLNHTFSEFDKEYVISAYYADYPSATIYNGIVNVNIVERYVDITSEIEDIDYGQNASLKLHLNETDAHGNIIIYLNGKEYSTLELTDDSNTDVEVKLDGLNAGSYDVTIEFEGDGYYLAKTFKDSFKVNKIDSTINIDVSDIKIGDTAVITVTLPSDATGEVTVKVNGETYNENEISLPNLSLGQYDIIVNYAGDINYNPSENTSSFTVSKKESTISIGSDVAVIGLNTTITLTVNDGATGDVLINISGETYNFNLDDGREFKIVLDHVGEYLVNATYSGNGEFESSTSETITVEVIDKYVPTIKINVPQDITVGSSVEISVETDGFNPIVKINNDDYPLTDGKIVFTPQNTGLYTVIVFTSENETYVAGYNLTAFGVDKRVPTIIIAPIDNVNVNDEVTITVSNDTSVVIKVNGIEIEGNSYTPKIEGDYIVTVESNENDEFKYASESIKFAASKKESSISISIDDDSKIAGDELTITVNSEVSSGIVLIKVNDDEYALNLENTKLLTVKLNNVGLNVISAVYLGNDEFKSSSSSEDKTVTVSDKITPKATITVDDVVYAGQSVSITIDTDGYNPIVKIGDEELDINADGTVSYTPTQTGLYTIILETSENATHKNVTITKSFYAAEDNTLIDPTIKIDPIENAVVGEKITINVETTGDGELTVTVNGVEIQNNEFTPEHEGTYTIVVKSPVTEKYASAFKTEIFEVSKKSSNVGVKVNTIASNAGDEVEITIDTELNEGIVLINVNNTQYLVDLKDSKSINVTLTKAGIHIINATYLANDVYAQSQVSENVNVTVTSNSDTSQSTQPVIHTYVLDSNKDLNVFYNSGATYTVRVLVDGKVAGAGETVSIVFNGKTTKVKTDKNGLIKFNIADKNVKPGLYTVTVKYQGQSVANIITVKSVIIAKKTTKVKKSAKSFKVKITLKGKNIKKQTVKVKFKGKTYTLKTNAKGVATLKVAKKVIKKLKKGKTYSYTITYNKDVLKREVKVI